MSSSESDEALESYGTEIGVDESPSNQFREWVLVGGNRIRIALLFSAIVLGLFSVLNWAGLIAFVNDDSMTRLAGGMTAGTFSLVTLVVSINQLILSQEFAVAGASREQFEGVREFRGNVAEAANVPAAPASPTKLLELLAERIHSRGETLSSSVTGLDDEELRDLITRYANRVQQSSDRMMETLEHTKFGTFQAVSSAIRYDSAWLLYVADHLSNGHGESLSEETNETLDGLIDELELMEIAQEHFKTTYLQRELTRFSQLMIYTGVPGILASITLALLYADFAGPAIQSDYLPYAASVLIGIAVFSVGLLASFILRTATVTHRTASTGPMIPQKDPNEGPFDVSYTEEEQ